MVVSHEVTAKISILIPVFNRQDYISDCIQSALNQTYQNIEVVIVDNASEDDTWGICLTFAAKDPRIRIFRNETNIGPVLNWKKCFDKAQGLYGKILFSDDLMSPDYLEKTLPFLQDPDVGFVFSSTEIGSSPGSGKISYRWKPESGKYPGEAFIESSLFSGDVPVSPGAALFRMVDLRQNLKLDIPSPSFDDFLDHGAGPDMLLYLLTAQKYNQVAYVSDPISFFRHHEESISVSSRGTYIWERYLQAKIWFGTQWNDGQMLESESVFQLFLACEWLKVCYRAKAVILPNKFIAQFLDPPVKIRLSAMARAVPYLVKRLLLRMI